MLYDWNLAPALTGFTREMAEVIERKYNRKFSTGQIEGYGKIRIP
jgi:hypothetical protein